MLLLWSLVTISAQTRTELDKQSKTDGGVGMDEQDGLGRCGGPGGARRRALSRLRWVFFHSVVRRRLCSSRFCGYFGCRVGCVNGRMVADCIRPAFDISFAISVAISLILGDVCSCGSSAALVSWHQWKSCAFHSYNRLGGIQLLYQRTAAPGSKHSAGPCVRGYAMCSSGAAP